MGKDPLAGDVKADEMLWILPAWAREMVKGICCLLPEQSSRFRIDGLEVRLAHGREKAHLTFSVKRTEPGPFAPMARKLLSRFPALVGIAVPAHQQVFGDTYLNHRVLGLNIAAHHTAFFQSNLYQLPELLTKVKSALTGMQPQYIMDLYCGVGLFSLLMGGKSSQVIGVDFNRGAIASAQKNAAALGFSKAQYICSSTEKFLSSGECSRQDLIFINPSRFGCGEKVIAATAAWGAEAVCSISCSIPSHIRDLLLWQRHGYRLRSLAAFDMFPFTDFLETAAVLEKER